MFSEQLPMHSIDSVEQYICHCIERIIKIGGVQSSSEMKLNVTWETPLIRKHEMEIPLYIVVNFHYISVLQL